MAEGTGPLSIGLPRMHKEPGERRDFLPRLVEVITRAGAPVVVESSIGSGMGLTDEDYARVSPLVRLATAEDAFAQDLVLVLRCPTDDEVQRMRPGATLMAMLHFPTRPDRIRWLADLGLEAIGLDSITDGRLERLVVNGEAVAWNGLQAAFDVLERIHPRFEDPDRGPIRVTILGAGRIGRYAVEASTKYGDLDRFERLEKLEVPGVEVVTLGRNMTRVSWYVRERLRVTDVFVDASQRDDASTPLIPNEWVGLLPEHAVICDLSVDPYNVNRDPPIVRAIEGIPWGDLDGYVRAPDDPAWERTVPAGVPTANRRWVVSCYSWPGVNPRPCMELYGRQLAPLLRALIQRGGIHGLRMDGDSEERALLRASLQTWLARPSDADPDDDPLSWISQPQPA